MTKFMSCDGGPWFQHTSKGKTGSCGFIAIKFVFGMLIFFGICGYQNLAPGCTAFLGKLAQNSFKNGGKLVLPL